MMKLSVVMPVYNETAFLEESVNRVLASEFVGQLVIVDDGSKDGSSAIAEQMGRLDARVDVYRHTVNRGKGAALRTGFRNVTHEVVLIQDADLEYDPGDYHKLLTPIESNRADVVYGSRYINGHRQVSQPFVYRAANSWITALSNVATGLTLTDVETCYKCFRRSVIEEMELAENRFGIEVEITAKVAAMGCRIAEVPVSYTGRTRSEGKKIGLKDGLEAFLCIVRYRKRSRPHKKRVLVLGD